MIHLTERVARALFARFGPTQGQWAEAPFQERERFREAARELLNEFSSLAPFEAAALVEKIRETRQTRLGFLYMAYSLNAAEAAALLAVQALGQPGECRASRLSNSA